MRDIEAPGHDSKAGMTRATGAALSAFADYFSAHRPDLLVVLGDRYEILPQPSPPTFPASPSRIFPAAT